mgnify:CR=1 FL=1
MKKIIIIPDSFKGSMSSPEVADILAAAATKYLKCDVIKIPIADGGEGSVDCILRAKGGTRRLVKVHSPEGVLIEAAFGIVDEHTAVIEIAESSGLTKQTGFHALDATTYGFGELIKAALDMDCRNFFLCLGGSATTDCGCGMAAALGVSFYNADKKSFIPTGGTLSEVAEIDLSHLDQRVRQSSFTVMSDVLNPLYGPMGAAYVFAPQKGATDEEVKILDAGLAHIAGVIERDCHVDCHMRAAGAAGGTGYGCAAFLGAEIVSGIDGLLSLCRFDALLQDCGLIVTGEGCLDTQSLMGKVLSGIRHHSGDIPIVSFCGICKVPADELADRGISAIEIGRGIPLTESMSNGCHYLSLAADTYFQKISGEHSF